MKILCTDLEGTLAPEIWQEIGNFFGINELNLTTRDISDFDELMSKRMDALHKNNVSYEKILNFVKTIKPFDGAKEFLSSIGGSNLKAISVKVIDVTFVFNKFATLFKTFGVVRIL